MKMLIEEGETIRVCIQDEKSGMCLFGDIQILEIPESDYDETKFFTGIASELGGITTIKRLKESLNKEKK